MGKIREGVLGGVSGKVGPVIGGSWRGINYLRGRGKQRTDNPTDGQSIHRVKFAVATKFVAVMSGLFASSYKNAAPFQTTTNAAFGNIMENAVTGVYPDIKLDYSLVLVAKGSLRAPKAASAIDGGNGSIEFSWKDNSGTGNAKPGDKSILVAYCAELDECEYITSGPERSTEAGLLQVPEFAGKKVHTWLAFNTAKGASDSVYTGEITVS